MPTRIAVVARDVELWWRAGGGNAVREVLRVRRGRAYDPAVVDAVLDVGDRLLAEVSDIGWDDLTAAEPVPVVVPADRLEGLLAVLADFADAKLPAALGHSRAVARIAGRAAGELGLDEGSVTLVRRAALVHDLGRAGVSYRVWGKPGPLSGQEREQVRLHPFLSEQVLVRSAVLRPLASPSGAHHERLDGSGYYRSVGADELGPVSRLLAAADAAAAMQEQRPHRPPLTLAGIAAELGADADTGRLDRRAVTAVLAAAGVASMQAPWPWPAGLTDREVQVLRPACRGATKRAVAEALGISPKTVNRHLESSYAKIGVTTRAAAALFAVEHGLLP